MNTTKKPVGAALTIATAAFALLAACGSPPPAVAPASASPADVGDREPGAPAKAGEPGKEKEPAPAAHAEPGEPVAAPLVASSYLGELAKIGINVDKATDLSKIPMREKKKLMPLFQRSLGYGQCTGCHAQNDFQKVTRNMEIARGMWNHFVAALRDDKGAPVFCDSCHQGKAKFLNRADKKAVARYMDAEYEHKLTRADKKDNNCETCHGPDMETKIIAKLWKVPPT
jgi:Cytochrome c7 and related cytochrome c